MPRLKLDGILAELATVRAALTAKRQAAAVGAFDRFQRYRLDPVGFFRDVLGATSVTPDQERAAVALLGPPYLVEWRAGHSVGKTWFGAACVNWWFYSRQPSVTITTAPTKRDVCDLLWAEVRLQQARARLPAYFIGPAEPTMKTGEDHYAKGYTAAKGESFQGRHRPSMLFIFDEAEGIGEDYFRTLGTMFQPGDDHAGLMLLNPTTTTSAAYLEEQKTGPDGSPKWHQITASCLNHPNVAADLAGLPRPIPNAITAAQLTGMVADWCERTTPDYVKAGDFEWPPASGVWWVPGPIAEARILGRRPSQDAYGVWGEGLWELIESGPKAPRGLVGIFPRMGCDVARAGDDNTTIHGQADGVSCHHERHNGWDTVKTAMRAMRVADLLALWYAKTTGTTYTGREVVVNVDDSGVGGGVVDIGVSKGYTFVGVTAARKPAAPTKFPNIRSELWFAARAAANAGRLSIAGLDARTRATLKLQALAVKYAMDAAGRRVAEPKEVTKKKLGGRSPDDMDALNLAYYNASGGGSADWVERDSDKRESVYERQQQRNGGAYVSGKRPRTT